MARGKLSRHIEMSGTVEYGKVTIEFTLPNREDTIIGTGDFPSEAKECKGTIEGELEGPAPDDRGDWIFDSLNPVDVIGGAAPYVCFAACSYAGGTDAQCDKQCGTIH